MDIGRLNVNVGGKASIGFSGDAVLFDDIGSRVGGDLPREYIYFIQTVDGGHPEVGSFLLPGGNADNYFDINWFYSFGDVRIENIDCALGRWSDVLGPGMLPIGTDAGGNQIYLDLNDSPSAVWLYIHDEDKSRIRVADSFGDFVSSLTMNPDFV